MMVRGGTAERRGFKEPVSQKHARQNRLTATLEIRKTKKDRRLKARRMGGVHNETSPRQEEFMLLLQQQAQQAPPQLALPSTVPESSATIIARCMNALRQWYIPGPNQQPLPSQPTDQVLEAIKDLRRLLTVEENPPVDDILAAGALPYLSLCLSYHDHSQVQLQASWALTNIASSTQTRQVFEEPGVVDQTVRLLSTSPDCDLREQSAWLLANMAGDCVEYRDILLDNLVLRQGLLLNLQNPQSLDLLKQAVSLVQNLTRAKPTPRRDHAECYLAPLAKVLQEAMTNPTCRDTELLHDVLWSFTNLSSETKSSEGRIAAVMEHATPVLLTGIMDLELKGNNSKAVMIPALRAMGNFVSGTQEQTQAVLDANFLGLAMSIMEHPSKAVQKELCWLLSNVCAGSHDQIKSIFSHQLDVPLIELAIASRWEIRVESMWAICNICSMGSDKMRSIMVAKGGVEALSRFLPTTRVVEKTLILAVLDAIEHLLKFNQERSGLNIPILLDQAGGIDKLESLQEHPDDDIYEKSKDIIEKYFGADGGVDEENEDPSAYLDEDGKFALKMPSRKLFGDDLNASSFTSTTSSHTYTT